MATVQRDSWDIKKPFDKISVDGEKLDQITLKFPSHRLNSVLLDASVYILYLYVQIYFGIHSQSFGFWSSIYLLSPPLPPKLIPHTDSSVCHRSIYFPIPTAGGGGGRKCWSWHWKKSWVWEFSFWKTKTLLKSRQVARVSSKIISQQPIAHY